MGDAQETIIQGISAQIMQHLRCQRSEESHPSYSADKMDDTINYHKAQVQRLREIRLQLEEAFAASAP